MIIALSGYSNIRAADESPDSSHFDDHLPKPVNADELEPLTNWVISQLENLEASMVPDDDYALLLRLLEVTRSGEIQWHEGERPDTWYESDLGSKFPASFRFLSYEATNQIGAEPMAIEFSMPGLNAVYFAGTPGFRVFREILSVAFENWRPAPDPAEPLRYLEEGVGLTPGGQGWTTGLSEMKSQG